MEDLASYAAVGLEDEAEEHLIKVLEERRARSSGEKNTDWDASVEGENPPLRRLSVEGINMLDPIQEEKKLSSPSKAFLKMAKKVMTLKSQGKLTDYKNKSTLENIEAANRASLRREVKESKNKREQVGKYGGGVKIFDRRNEFSRADTSTNRLFGAAMAVEETLNEQDNDTDSIISETGDSESMGEELLPLTGTEESSQHQNRGWFGYGSADTDGSALKSARKKKWRMRRKKCAKILNGTLCHGSRLAEMFHPVVLLQAVGRFVTSSWFTKIGLPALMIAFFLFYYMGNPTLDFMNQATASWWLIFLARQTLTLELALVSESFMIGLALRSKLVVRIFGPLVTLFIINSRGWPFISTSWAIWDLFLLHGDDKFKQNWLYFTRIQIFSQLNKGGRHILFSKLYLRILIAMMTAGFLTAVKRTIVAFYLGQRTFVNYKPRLEKLLADIFMITQVAELASEADVIAKMQEEAHSSINEAVAEKKRSGMLSGVQWKSLKEFGPPKTSTSQDRSDSETLSLDPTRQVAPRDEDEVQSDDLTDSDGSDDGKQSDSESDDRSSDGDPSSADNAAYDSAKFRSVTTKSSASAYVSPSKMKRNLDRWEEPINKTDKTAEASISDILKFRKALSYMDDAHPFSLLFGPAATRDECIRSAQRCYRGLVKLEAPDANALSFDVIGLVAFDAEGTEDEAMMLALRNMFHPGRFDEISLVAFVQACDSLYKRLRYFRASVGNASLIDHVLERIIDDFFAFVLMLLILAILDINPWPLLVSVSTLLVSFAFAIGPSLSRYIDGMLMIIVRRPYDLGDRIVIASSESVADPDNVTSSWFVEDITIFSTTLRFGPTNEIATVDNGSLARSRIVNYNRSPLALVTLKLRFCLAPQKQIHIFREALESFVQDRPSIWSQIMFFRCDNIDKDALLMEYVLRVRHTKAWQDAASILMSRSELFEFCYELGEKLAINFDPPPPSMRVTNSFAPSPKESSEAPAPSESIDPSSAVKALFLQISKGGTS